MSITKTREVFSLPNVHYAKNLDKLSDFLWLMAHHKTYPNSGILSDDDIFYDFYYPAYIIITHHRPAGQTETSFEQTF